MNGLELLEYCGTDAARWAEKLTEIGRELHTSFDDPETEGWLIGWFANAMCCQEQDQRQRNEKIEIETLGLLSSVLASRSDAWDGNAPEWFPEPPEWLDLWEKARMVVTADKEAPDYQELVEALA